MCEVVARPSAPRREQQVHAWCETHRYRPSPPHALRASRVVFASGQKVERRKRGFSFISGEQGREWLREAYPSVSELLYQQNMMHAQWQADLTALLQQSNSFLHSTDDSDCEDEQTWNTRRRRDRTKAGSKIIKALEDAEAQVPARNHKSPHPTKLVEEPTSLKSVQATIGFMGQHPQFHWLVDSAELPGMKLRAKANPNAMECDEV